MSSSSSPLRERTQVNSDNVWRVLTHLHWQEDFDLELPKSRSRVTSSGGAASVCAGKVETDKKAAQSEARPTLRSSGAARERCEEEPRTPLMGWSARGVRLDSAKALPFLAALLIVPYFFYCRSDGERRPRSLPEERDVAGRKRFPRAIIIGVKKGGTRALLEFLRIHPDVRAVGAEPHFFDRFYGRGLEWYRNLMPRTLDGQITMEKTPSYFVTKEAPSRVCTLNCQTKLIVVVRDPVTRAVSDYTQTLSKNPGLPSFQSLALRNASAGPIDTSWSAVRIGLYAKHLENWLRYFPLSHFLFVCGERLVSDPAGEMGRVQDFLGLKRVVSEKHFYFNQTKGFPCLKKPEGSSRPRCLGKSKGRPHPRIPTGVLQKLRDFYRPYNRRFYQLSGQDFGWD